MMRSNILYTLLIVLGVAVLAFSMGLERDGEPEAATSVIVQATDAEQAAEAVRSVGGEITHVLGIIDAVAARLTDEQLEAVKHTAGFSTIHADRSVEVAGKPTKASAVDSLYPDHVGARQLHAEGIDGSGVTVAVLDTGFWQHKAVTENRDGGQRVLASYDAIKDGPFKKNDADWSGHGTHVTSIVLSSENAGTAASSKFNGIAPNADFVAVRAFNSDGAGTYANVIRGIDWVVNNKSNYGIRVLNISFSAPPQSHYWEDPLNQAVMRAWQEGIVVVASAGNTGPDAMTIGVPGNVPYVITVGAMTDNYTPADSSDDVLASFSSAGPTVEGFVKPEVVAPGGHMLGLMRNSTVIATKHRSSITALSTSRCRVHPSPPPWSRESSP